MRRHLLFVMAVLGVCLAFGLSVPSAQRMGASAGMSTPSPAGPGNGGIGSIGGIGGGGQRNPPGERPPMLMGFTTRLFPMGVGPLVLSRACQEERPNSRLCEWHDIFSAIPPIGLDREVLVAANFDTRPMPMCLNPGGGLRCDPSNTMRPAACCGFPAPPDIPMPAALTLTPSGPLTISSCSDTFDFTVTATDADGKPMEGALISFNLVPVVGGTALLFGTFTPFGATSDANGQVSSVLALNAESCQSTCVEGAEECRMGVQALASGPVPGGPVYSNLVNLVDGIQ